MDFIESLPKSGTMDYILVVVDRFSKYIHFLALAHPFAVAEVARVFLDNVYKLHGMPSPSSLITTVFSLVTSGSNSLLSPAHSST